MRITGVIVAVVFMLFVGGGIFLGVHFASPIDTPANLQVSGTTLSWNKVAAAEKYEVVVNGTTATTSNTQLNIAGYLKPGENIAKVKALRGSLAFFSKDSEFSLPWERELDSELAKPANFRIEDFGNAKLLKWDESDAASAYRISIQLTTAGSFSTKTLQTSGNWFDVTEELDPAGIYSYKISALPDLSDSSSTFFPSDYTAPVTDAFYKPLAIPGNVSLTRDNLNRMWLHFNTVSGAKHYLISVLGGSDFAVTNVSPANITDLFAGVPITNARFACVAAIAQDTGYNTNSSFSDFAAWYNTSALNSLNTLNFDMFGSTIKSSISNQAELNAICRWAIFNRITGFYIHIDNSYNPTMSAGRLSAASGSSLHNAIMAYPEILDLYVGTDSNSLPSRVHKISLEFRNPQSPHKTQTGKYSTAQEQAVAPMQNGDGSFVLPIDSVTNTYVVYNSEQLFWAVQAGYKPLFATGHNSDAQRIYNEARTVLDSILVAGMTDYQIALAIYQHIVFNTKYDYNLYNKPSYGPGKSEFINRGFYLEGVFLDAGNAVCDGFSKAYSLLCNMAGVECYKANGVAGGGTDWGGHAWNKVKITTPVNGTRQWYVVDTTWADITITTGNHHDEMMTHRYFLKTDVEMYSSHREDNPPAGMPANPVANTTFNYYTATKYDGTNSIDMSNNGTNNYGQQQSAVNSLATWFAGVSDTWIEFRITASVNLESIFDSRLGADDYIMRTNAGGTLVVVWKV
ncbi:MAG: hypothetical protein FWE53_01440 [Firmicutes bacterium]|nr:hypothetical protein [Bacillota bacterium]